MRDLAVVSLLDILWVIPIECTQETTWLRAWEVGAFHSKSKKGRTIEWGVLSQEKYRKVRERWKKLFKSEKFIFSQSEMLSILKFLKGTSSKTL